MSSSASMESCRRASWASRGAQIASTGWIIRSAVGQINHGATSNVHGSRVTRVHLNAALRATINRNCGIALRT